MLAPETTNPSQGQPGVAPEAEGEPTARIFAGRYVVRREIGRGGMGRVFVAHDERLSREVALKVLAAGPHDERQLHRFEHEARTAGSLNHPNVLIVHDAGEENGEPYIVTELPDGGTLRKALNDRSLALDQIADLMRQLAHGLVAAHDHGIVHRDLKPENLFITESGILKILDFDIARLPREAACEERFRTASGEVYGTVSYMSPEQVRGHEVDSRSDLFAFGAIFHEMLSGGPPFDRATALETAEAIISEPPARLPVQVPAGIARIVERCLQKDPADRFVSAQALAEALARMSTPVPSRVRRWSVAIFAAILASAAAGAVLVGALPRLRPEAPRITVAAADFVNETKDEELDGLSGMLITSLEESKRLSVLTRGRMFDVLKQLGRGDAERIDEQLGREICKRANASALVLASIRRFGELYTIDLKVLDPLKNEYLFTAKEEGKGKDSIPAMIDRLSERTRAGLKEKSEEIDATRIPIAQRTTANLEAYQYYFQGEQLLARSLDFDGGVQKFRHAVQLDPRFALAHFWLGLGLSWIYDRAFVEEFETAQWLGLSGRERCLAEAELARGHGDWSRAKRLIDECAIRFPDEKLINFIAGDWRFHLYDPPGAVSYFEKTLAIDPTFTTAIEHLLETWHRLGANDKALKLGEDYAARVHDATAYDLLAFAQQIAGQRTRAMETLHEAARVFPDSPIPAGAIARAYLFAGEPDLAESAFRPILDERFGPRAAFSARIELDVYGGRFRRAIAALDDAASRYGRAGDARLASGFTFQKALVLAIGRRDFAAARRIAEDLGPVDMRTFWLHYAMEDVERAAAVLQANPAAGGAPFRLDALRERKKGLESEAVAKYERLVWTHWPLLELAGLHLDLADAQKAVAALHKLQAMYPDIYSDSPLDYLDYSFWYPRSFFRLGQAYELAGDGAAALKSYERFLALWKNADPDLEEVHDARARLTALSTVVRE